MIEALVLTGFLGSGKTTLLGRLLRQPEFSRTAVIINEFGDIGLDHDLCWRWKSTIRKSATHFWNEEGPYWDFPVFSIIRTR